MKGDNSKLFSFGPKFVGEGKQFGFIDLIQVCEVALLQSCEIPKHRQICHEITYIVSGGGYFYTNDSRYEVKRGDIHVISSGDRHAISAKSNEKLRYICIGFNFASVPDEYRETCEFFGASPEIVFNADGDIRCLFDMLIQEFYVSRKDSDCVIENLLKLIISKVHRCFIDDIQHKSQAPERGMGDCGTVYKIIKYIDDNVYAVKSVGEIAKKLNYTENYTSNIFRKKMGVTLQTYIREKKLETSRILLKYGNLTIAEVAEQLNFDSVQSFGKNFKKLYGLTPKQYSKGGAEKVDGAEQSV